MFGYYRNFFINKKIKKFNKQTFKKKKVFNKNLILCEFSNNAISQVAFSYLSNFLSQKLNAEIIGYQYLENLNFLQKLKFYSQKFINYSNFGIYRSFNVKNIILINNKYNKNFIIKKKLDYIKKSLKSKKKLLFLKFDQTLVGDLIYDTYLKRYSVGTVDLSDPKLERLVFETYILYEKWKNFFSRNSIKALIVSDTVYIQALVTRIAVFNKIPTYQCAWNNITKINTDNLYCYGKFKFYKKYFSKFKKTEKIKALNLAKKKIQKRIKGEIGIDDQVNFEKTAWYKQKIKTKVFAKSKKKKFLIAAHAFFDGPHAMGPKSILFNDFTEWLNYLLRIMIKTDYDWYIKGHPNFNKIEDQILENIVSKIPNLHLIDKKTPHYQIINEGVSCVLTVRGTIAWEYALFEIPVINASLLNPHIDYDFCLHSKNIKDYKNKILNFDKYKINFNKSKIYEFYFMHNILSFSDWMLHDYKSEINKIGGYKNLGKKEFYEYWMMINKEKKLDKINEKLKKFLNSDKIFMFREFD